MGIRRDKKFGLTSWVYEGTKNLVLLHGYMKGQKISTFLYMALIVNHSLHARKSHVFKESLCTSSFIFFKNISLRCMVNFPEKIQNFYLKSMGGLSVVPRKMCEFRARKITPHSIGKHDGT